MKLKLCHRRRADRPSARIGRRPNSEATTAVLDCPTLAQLGSTRFALVMSERYLDRRRFCGAAAASMAAGSLAILGSSRRLQAMTEPLRELSEAAGSESARIPRSAHSASAFPSRTRRSAPAHQGDAVARRETVTDDTQGVQLATMQELAHYWGRLRLAQSARRGSTPCRNSSPRSTGSTFTSSTCKSKEKNALPIIITHGWPGSIIEQMKVIDPLTNPTAHGGKRGGRVRRRDPVAAGLRILRQADGDRLGSAAHRARMDDADAAARLHAVRRAGRRLGQRGLGEDGAAGAARVARHLDQHGGDRSRRDQQGAGDGGSRRRPSLSADERNAWEQLDFFYKKGLGYANEMALRPQTLYGIADSPIGLAAWMLDHDARELRAHRARLRRAERRTDARRHPRQHHALLVDEHGDLVGAALLGQRTHVDGRLLRRRGT